ncbi:MAG: hypothetical protein AB7W16_21880 [Candidatus Obscuribacterales bacterium]
MNRIAFLSITGIPLALGLWLGLSGPCPAQTETESDGVVIKRNPDGSIETYDAPGGGGAPAGSSRRSAPAKSYVKKHGDGVVVKRNPDGSIETYDTSDSYYTRGASGTSKTSRKPGARKRAAGKASHTGTKTGKKTGTKARAKAGAKRHRSGDVVIKRNADGSIETWDAN